MKICYVPKRFNDEHLAIIDTAESICDQYQEEKLDLTLRQLYYRFVAQGLIPNTEQSYKRLGSIINDARLAGLIDWEHLKDRGREAHETGWFGHIPPELAEIVAKARFRFAVDLWEGQARRVEIWVEKQALEQVVERAANAFRVPFFACKGYVSQSEMWAAGQRMVEYLDHGYDPLIVHLGDHDPSGIDMSRDIEDRLTMFAERPIEVRRIALNMDQIEELQPPPQPAKVTDSRHADYRERFGDESWELDALEPTKLIDLITAELEVEVDPAAWNEQVAREREGRDRIQEVADRWSEVEQFLKGASDD